MLTIMWLPPRYCLHDHLPNRGNDLSQGAACGVRKDLGCSVDQPPLFAYIFHDVFAYGIPSNSTPDRQPHPGAQRISEANPTSCHSIWEPCVMKDKRGVSWMMVALHYWHRRRRAYINEGWERGYWD